MQASERTPLTGKVALDQRVISADGVDLGYVKDMTSKEFQVAAERESGYWLDRQSIAGIEGDRLRIAFDASQVPAQKVPNNLIDRSEPAASPEAQGVVQDASPLDVLGREQDRAREQMERELAVQRQRLSALQPGRDAPPDTGGTAGEPVESELARRAGVPVSDVVHSARHAAERPAAGDRERTTGWHDVSDVRGMHVMAAREGRELGVVKDVLFDAEHRAVFGIMVDAPAEHGSRMFVAKPQIKSFAGHAVTVESESAVRSAMDARREREMIEQGIHLEGLKVVTESGDSLGKLDRVLLDDAGDIAGYHAKSGLLGLGARRDIAPADVVSIGPDAVVVRDHAA